MRPVDNAYLLARIQQIAGVTSSSAAGPMTSVTLPMEIRINDPETGDTLKTFYVPDARITPPGPQARVQQKLEVTFQWSSDAGVLEIYRGARS